MTPGDSAPLPPPALAVLISGGGRTLLNLHDRITAGALHADIRLVIASAPCPGAELARQRNLPVLVVPGAVPAPTLERILRDHDAHWIVLAGYLKKLNLPDAFRRRAVNIHPALLPAFGGAGMYGLKVHQAVLNAGCRVSGCTVHLVDDHYDTGPIIAQRACPVHEDDDAHALAARVFDLERELYPWALARLLAGRVVPDPAGSPRMRILPM
ncbi:MAG: phosphoribosylglycinamide formyltransferase [Planctomycetota bacterium]|nr:phosphoribosylglycinamide formyltransferase [Planctomycetota bacterium]